MGCAASALVAAFARGRARRVPGRRGGAACCRRRRRDRGRARAAGPAASRRKSSMRCTGSTPPPLLGKGAECSMIARRSSPLRHRRSGGGRRPRSSCRSCAGCWSAGGATLVQLRDKQADTRTCVARARAIKAALAHGVPLLVNDRVDVALAARRRRRPYRPGRHAAADARRLLGPERHHRPDHQDARRADAPDRLPIDYAGIGGVYRARPSRTTRNPPIGIAGLAHRVIEALHRAAAELPICGIAGIDASNAAPVIEAGADGVAVISALSLAEDPRPRPRRLRALVDAGARRQRGALMTAIAVTIAGSDFERRRRHPGRPEDVLGARRLRRLRDHGADRAEHQGRQRHPRRAAGVRRGADRRACSPTSTSAR